MKWDGVEILAQYGSGGFSLLNFLSVQCAAVELLSPPARLLRSATYLTRIRSICARNEGPIVTDARTERRLTAISE